ncbi:MAG: NAD(P)-dependent oxidoreductase [Peptococcaceae bacterium]
MKAVIIDHVSKIIGESLVKYGVEVDYKVLPTKQELINFIGNYDLLIMRVDPFIDKEIIDAATNLKSIHVCSVGTNHIDLTYCREKGILVTNAPGANSNAVAELTLSKILDLFRNTMQSNTEIKGKNIWNKYRWIGMELKGKTLGIIGYGKIGSRVGEIAQALDMTTIAYDPYLDKEEVAAKGTELVSLKELLNRSDCITLHTPLTEETHNMISYEQIAELKEGAFIINTGRGGVLNEEAAYDNLKSGKLGGVSVDVLATELGTGGLSSEDVVITSPLFEFDNFTVSSHIGGASHDAYDAIGVIVVGKIVDTYQLQEK